MSSSKKPDFFTQFTTRASAILGRAWIFVVALILLVIWAVSGPIFQFSDTWQLIVNTSTTIVTFLMVFIIQNTQNRDNLALNIKLDALMKKAKITNDDLLEAEDKSDTSLEHEVKSVQKPSARKRSVSKRSKKK